MAHNAQVGVGISEPDCHTAGEFHFVDEEALWEILTVMAGSALETIGNRLINAGQRFVGARVRYRNI